MARLCWPLSVLIVGFLLFTATIVTWIQFPSLLNSKIEEQLQLRNGSETFEKWRNITIPIYIKFTFFNVTNPNEILYGHVPILKEVGPFVYQETRLKTIDGINLEEDTVTYRQAITYYFRPDLSVGSDDTLLTILNIPLVSVAKEVSVGDIKGNFAGDRVQEFFQDNPDEKSIFLERSVRQLLFDGYKVPLLEYLSEFKGDEILPNHTFGLYYPKNGTSGLPFTVFSGTRSSKEFGQIQSWDNQKELNWWNNDPYCNQINGSDGSVFTPFITRDRILRLFSDDFCRSSYLTYQKDIEYMGIPGYRFTMPLSIWKSGDVNPENKCFCKIKVDGTVKECNRNGTFSLSACKKGAPVFASSPYFLGGNEDDQKMYNLVPNPEDHETYIDIEPTTGMVLRGRKMFQVNIELNPTKKVFGFKRLPSVLLPILWGEEYATTTEERAADLKLKLITSVKIVNIAKWCFLFVSIGLMLYGLHLIVKGRTEKIKF